jgi:hypothetical protein
MAEQVWFVTGALRGLGRSVDFDATGVDLPEHRPAPASG